MSDVVTEGLCQKYLNTEGYHSVPSVLQRLGGRKGIRPVENASELQTFIGPVIGKYNLTGNFF